MLFPQLKELPEIGQHLAHLACSFQQVVVELRVRKEPAGRSLTFLKSPMTHQTVGQISLETCSALAITLPARPE